MIFWNTFMDGKHSDDDKGLAEQSLNTSTVPPTDANPHRRDEDKNLSGGRQLKENDQRRGLKEDSGRKV